jgi:hypothetical protein
LLTIAMTWLLLFLYSTSAKLASQFTVLAAFISVIWMLGALRLMGFGIDPMNMLTPFLIFAIAVSHGEQMINRFRGEIFFGGLEDGSVDELRARQGVDPLDRGARAFRMLLVPGTVALLAGCIGFATILMIPIRIIFELAITATVGVAHHHPHRPDPAAGAAQLHPPAQHGAQARVPPAPAHPLRPDLGADVEVQQAGAGRRHHRWSVRRELVLRRAHG